MKRVKCWNCGSENAPRLAFCSSCVMPLEGPRSDRVSKAPVRVILRRIGGVIIVTAGWLCAYLAAISLIVWTCNTLSNRGPLEDLGKVLAGTGAVLAFITMYSLARIPERRIAASKFGGIVLYNTLFKPIWKTATSEPSRMEVRRSFVFTLVGVASFVIGLFLV